LIAEVAIYQFFGAKKQKSPRNSDYGPGVEVALLLNAARLEIRPTGERPMFKNLTAAVALLAAAATIPVHAETIAEHCRRPALPIDDQIICSSPRMMQATARNLVAYQQLSSQLNPGDQAELIRRMTATKDQTLAMCLPGGQRTLPLAPGVEDCLLRRSDYVYGELQRGVGILAGAQAQQRQQTQNNVGNFFQNLQNNWAATHPGWQPFQPPSPVMIPETRSQSCTSTYGGGTIQTYCQ
jgi:hypothetical protein